MTTVKVWTSDFGDITLPPDFPTFAMRKDGLWDKRFRGPRIEMAKAFIVAETQRLRDA